MKATVTTIKYAGLSFEGLMMPNGEYRIAFTQCKNLFLKETILSKNVTRAIKALLPKEFSFSKCETELHSKKIWTMDLTQFTILMTILMSKGNPIATNFVIASTTEKLERVFDTAFDVLVTEREREARFAARLDTKATFKPLTDELKKFGFSESWQYGKFVKQFQDIIGFESGERDKLELSTLLELGNCQSELKMLMRVGYSPWEALNVWSENR